MAARAAGKWPNARSTSPSSSMRRGSRVVSGTVRKDTPGACCSKPCTKPGISCEAVASAMVSTKLHTVSAGENGCGANAVCKRASVSRTCGHSSSALGVGCKLRPWRTSTSSPKASRKRRRALLTAGCVSDSTCAARVRLRSAITTSKTLRRFRSKLRSCNTGRVINRFYECVKSKI